MQKVNFTNLKCLLLLLVFNSCSQRAAGISDVDSTMSFDLRSFEKYEACVAKGRFQDVAYNHFKVVDDIIKNGKDSIPILIESIADETRLSKPLFCYWSSTTIGDAAFFILSDLFLDSNWRTTSVPEASLDYLIGPVSPGLSFEQHYRNYLVHHGASSLKKKWIMIWEKYGTHLQWNAQEAYFEVG